MVSLVPLREQPSGSGFSRMIHISSHAMLFLMYSYLNIIKKSKKRARDGNRTRDPLLGKEVLHR